MNWLSEDENSFASGSQDFFKLDGLVLELELLGWRLNDGGHER